MPARFSCRISKEKKTSTLRSSVLLVFGQAVRRTINYRWWGWNKVERVPIAMVSRSLSFRFDFFSKCNTQFRNTNFGFLETLISYHNLHVFRTTFVIQNMTPKIKDNFLENKHTRFICYSTSFLTVLVLTGLKTHPTGSLLINKFSCLTNLNLSTLGIKG